MNTPLALMLVLMIMWLAILSFFMFAIMPSFFEFKKEIGKLKYRMVKFKNRVSRWLTGNR